MKSVPSDSLQVGDVIMPPSRELNLWMRRHIADRNLPESALYLTVSKIREGTPDKRGRWLIMQAEQSDEWYNGGNYDQRVPFTFKVRPATAWPLIERRSQLTPV